MNSMVARLRKAATEETDTTGIINDLNKKLCSSCKEIKPVIVIELDIMGNTTLPWFLTHKNPKEIYTKGKYLVVDFEAFGPDKASPIAEESDLYLACWQVWVDNKLIKKQHCWGGIYQQQELLDDIASVDFIVAQFAKYEMQWLKRCGAELRDILLFDTMLAEWCLLGNKKDNKNLEALAKRYGVPGKIDQIGSLIKQGVDIRDINPRWVLSYCEQDVEATHQVFRKQLVELERRSIFHLVHVRNMTCAVLADIEFEGLTLDPERVMEEYNKAIEIKERLGKELAEITGGINLKSPKQKAQFLYDTMKFEKVLDYKGKVVVTDSGNDSTDANTLAKLKATTPEQERFLKLYKEYSKQDNLLTKNLEYFKLTCEQRDCKFYGNLQQGVVQTHRLSSSGRPVLFKGLKKTKSVQFQNLPREYKKLFWSGDKDWYIRDDDGSQLEFRVAVEMGHDVVGLHEIENGVDIHAATARTLFDNGDPEIVGLPAEKRRQESKKSTFRPLYGGSQGSPALQAYCEYFKAHYAGVSKTQYGWALKCCDKGQFTAPYGMTFFFPDTKMSKRGYINNTTSIYNYPVQGFATGEIIPIALVYFWHRTRKLRVKIMNTVHDSIASKCHKDDIEEVDGIAKQCFTYDVYEFLKRVYHLSFRVPLGLESKHALHWGEGKGRKVDVWSDGREVVR